MEEAITFEMPSQLRGLFVTLILDGGPAPKLWNDYENTVINQRLKFEVGDWVWIYDDKSTLTVGQHVPKTSEVDSRCKKSLTAKLSQCG